MVGNKKSLQDIKLALVDFIGAEMSDAFIAWYVHFNVFVAFSW